MEQNTKMENANQIESKFKRKRKKSFLKNARKYAKKGHYGRGSQIDQETYDYFVRILEAYREGFDNEDDKKLFANNVFEQTMGRELDCCCNQIGCRVVEMLLPLANDDTLQRFMDSFGSNLRPLCCDRFATHVLEILISESCKKSYSNSICKEFVLKVSKFLLNNLEDFVWNNYGNHVIRRCLINLAGLPQNVDNKTKQSSSENNNNNDNNEVVQSDYAEIIKDYGERLIVWPQFKELCFSDITSGLLQILMKSLKRVDSKLLKRYQKKLLDEIYINNSKNENGDILPDVFLSQPPLMLLETSIELAKPKIYNRIYSDCFKNKLAKLATKKSTHFCVQKLLAHCAEKIQFEEMFDELKDDFKGILDAGNGGVILSLAQSCKKFSTKQGLFVQYIMSSLGCAEPEERQLHLVMCLSKLKNYEEVTKNSEFSRNEKLNLNGTLILEAILDFNKPIKIVNSLLNMNQSDLQALFTNTIGSHIADSFFKSISVGLKNKEKLIRKLKGGYQEMAGSTHGSRSLETIWAVSDLKHKLIIMEELSDKDASWSNSEHGKFVAKKVSLALFKRSKEDWKQRLNSKKAEEIFKDIL